MNKIQAVRGMNDILPDESPQWEFFEDTCRAIFRQYGYRNMRVPIVEQTPLFVRSIGEVTDIVEREMYSFEDKLNNEKLTLRPEATAGIVRAAIEHNLIYNGPMRVWTSGPMFRHERPQKGRYRQFYQMDVEALGFAGPDVEAEQMIMLTRLWKALGIGDVKLHINSIGDASERQAYRQRLIEHFERHTDVLDEDAKRRLYTNPLRILDSKNARMQAVIEAAPRFLDDLKLAGGESYQHFLGVQRLLTAASVAFTTDTRLVRGLDYYNRTVFEFISSATGSPLTIAGGGRYDGLFEQLGGKPAPACGFGLGIERVLMHMPKQEAAADALPLAYVVHVGSAAEEHAWRVCELVRDAKLNVTLGAGGSFKSQMKKADGSGAPFAIIIGDDEANAGTVTLKTLATGEQATLPLDSLVPAIRAQQRPT